MGLELCGTEVSAKLQKSLTVDEWRVSGGVEEQRAGIDRWTAILKTLRTKVGSSGGGRVQPRKVSFHVLDHSASLVEAERPVFQDDL